MDWFYKSITDESTGYEDVYGELSKYNRELFLSVDDLAKKEMIEKVFRIYRDRGIFPIRYYNEDGITKEIEKCFKRDVYGVGFRPRLRRQLANAIESGWHICWAVCPEG